MLVKSLLALALCLQQTWAVPVSDDKDDALDISAKSGKSPPVVIEEVVTLPATSAVTTFYGPQQSRRDLPTLIIIHGFNMITAEYSTIARGLAGTGRYLVSVSQSPTPNSTQEIISDTVDYLPTLNGDPNSAFKGRVDTGNVVLVGHSQGGGVMWNALDPDRCAPPNCNTGSWNRPPEIKGGIALGATLIFQNVIIPVELDLPSALLHGDLDGREPIEEAVESFETALQGTDRALAIIKGANHYFPTNSNPHPPPARPDPNGDQDLAQDLTQRITVRFVAVVARSFIRGNQREVFEEIEDELEDSEIIDFAFRTD